MDGIATDNHHDRQQPCSKNCGGIPGFASVRAGFTPTDLCGSCRQQKSPKNRSARSASVESHDDIASHREEVYSSTLVWEQDGLSPGRHEAWERRPERGLPPNPAPTKVTKK